VDGINRNYWIFSPEFAFSNPTDGNRTIEVELYIRRSFIELMDWKSWELPDILMESEQIIIAK
jgi:hypothetical protein